MSETKKETVDTLFEAVCDIVHTGAALVEEVIETAKPPEEECRKIKRQFWELGAKVASGFQLIAESKLRDLKNTPDQPRHAEPIVVDED